MKAQVSVINADRAKRSAAQLAKRLQTEHDRVLVGVQRGAGTYDDGTPTAVIAAANHFGADIDHPGGTSYGYKSERDAEAGRVRFLKDGEGFMEIGKTGPHKINIPARPFLDTGVEKNQRRYANIAKHMVPKILEGEATMDQTLDAIGLAAASDVQEYMVELQDPPNSPVTIAKKGSANPLIDTGHLRQSIRHEIAREPVEEGL